MFGSIVVDIAIMLRTTREIATPGLGINGIDQNVVMGG